MISISEATDIVLQNKSTFGLERIPLRQAYGRVLSEDLRADRDFPPFTRVTMDGIAITYQSFADGQRSFPIDGIQAAGAVQRSLDNPQHCLEVMTGAILPIGTDTVVRYEDLEMSDGQAKILVDTIKKGQNAHPKGSDRSTGELIIPANRRISPGEVGVAATVGKDLIQVRRLPNTLIIYTGDELVGVNETPLVHQIRTSNVYAIDSILSGWNIEADMLHLIDEKDQIRKELSRCLEEYDLIVLSGGVSKGKYDFVPEILEELGVQKRFHRVKQRPGKPFWFGHTEHTTVFALPGNPVSSFMCTYRYLIPWLRQSLGLIPFPPAYATLSEPFSFKPDLTYFLQVKLVSESDGQLLASPVAGRGSGDLANLADADGLLELPAEQENFAVGESFPLIRYR